MPPAINNFKKENYTDKFLKEHYNEKFHDAHWRVFRGKNKIFGKIILETYNFDSIVDYGCSIGSILEVFLEKNKKVKGFEYCYEESLKFIRKIPNLENFIEFGDVTKIISTEKFKCSISIEVAEHIPKESSRTLVKNLTNSAEEMIIFTAAGPGQGGTGHINCQKKIFWINLFDLEGWKYDYEETKLLKSKCIPTPVPEENTYPHIWKHVYDNLLVFKKKIV